MPNSALSGDRSCSSNSGRPADCRARIAPRIASSCLCLGRSPRAPCRTASRLQRACPRREIFPRRGCSLGHCRATGLRRGGQRWSEPWRPAPPMRPERHRRAEATSGSGLELLDEAAEGLRVAAHADGVDHADQQVALAACPARGAGRHRRRSRGSLRGLSVPTRPAAGLSTTAPAQARRLWCHRWRIVCRRGLLGGRRVGLEEADQRALLGAEAGSAAAQPRRLGSAEEGQHGAEDESR